MKKILIIGQAPSVRKEGIPFEKTLLYEMLGWVGISKEQAQETFEFESCIAIQAMPTVALMRDYYQDVLKTKIAAADHIIILGQLAADFYTGKKERYYAIVKNFPWIKVLILPHPSYRNYTLVMDKKQEITLKLKVFLSEMEHV